MSITQHQLAIGQPIDAESQDDRPRDFNESQADKEKAKAQIDAYLSGSDNRATDTTGIQRRTLECQALFESCQKNSYLAGDDWIDKMSAEFNWWSLGIGAAKGGHSSLDYRVQTREDVRNGLVNLLDSLATSLGKYIDAVSESCSPPNLTVTPAQDKDLQGATTQGSESQASENGAMIDEQRYYIETTIRYLVKISMAIRKSGTKYRHQRVDKLLVARESELKEFRDYMRYFLLMSPTKVHTLHRVLHQHSLTGDLTWKILWITLKAYFTDIQRLTPVQNRLIQANLVRRNRFDLYLARFRRHMRAQKGQQFPRVQTGAVTMIAPKQPRAPTSSQSHVSQISSTRDRKTPIQPFGIEGSQPSSLSATKIGTFVMPQRPQEQKARSVSTKLSQGVLKQDYPKCPGAEGESFWCPYCAQLLDASYSDSKKNKRWRGHVVEDLNPYVCVYEDCDSPDAMYVTTLEWKKHIREKHSRTQWICDPCWLDSERPEEFEFDTEEEWHKHTLTEHEDEVEEDDLPDLAGLSRRTGVPPIACPLCYEDASLRNPETDNHLAAHIHSFALQALPWEMTGCDDETHVSIGSDIRKSNHSGDSEQSTPEKLEEDNDEMAACQALLTNIISRSRGGILVTRDSLLNLLTEMRDCLEDLSALWNGSKPSLRSEISSSVSRLGSILQRRQDESFDFGKPSSIDTFQQDLAEVCKSLQHLARLSLVDSLEAYDPHASEAIDYLETPEPVESFIFDTARDPENWDIDSSDGVHADVPTVKRILPYERNSKFIARPELSERIFSMIPISSYEFQSAVLWGVGGSGKTQLALEYAYARCGDPSCSIFWVRAGSAATFATDYRLIAKELAIEQHLKGDDLLAAVCSGIESHQAWVLILDGADDSSLFKGVHDSEYLTSLFDFVPQGPGGTVLWTTCDPNVVYPQPPSCIKITSMTYAEAEWLFASTRDHMVRNRDALDMRDETTLLLQELQYLPLAIVQAGSFMRHTDTSVDDYMTLFSERKQLSKLLVPEDRLWIIHFTSAISLDWIRQQDRVANHMVHVLAYLDNRNITLALLYELIRDTPDATNREDSQRLSRATEELAALYLISPAGSTCQNFEMHQLVQGAVRDYQNDLGPGSKFTFSATALDLAKRLFSANHAVRVCTWAATCSREIDAAALLSQVSRSLDDEELWLEKESVDKQVLELRKRVLGESHPETISSLMSLAGTFFQQGRSDKAMKLVSRVLEMRHQTLGERNSYAIKGKVAMGMIYHQQGRYRQAEVTYSEALNLQIQGSGLEMEARPYIIDCLAWTYYVQGRYEEAKTHLNDAWHSHLKLHGDQHPDTLQALHQLAVVVYMNFNPLEGFKLMQTCVKSRRAVLGFAHPLTNVSTLLLEEWRAEQKKSTGFG